MSQKNNDVESEKSNGLHPFLLIFVSIIIISFSFWFNIKNKNNAMSLFILVGVVMFSWGLIKLIIGNLGKKFADSKIKFHGKKHNLKDDSKGHSEPVKTENRIDAELKQKLTVKNCPNCGYALNKEDNFCYNCGNDVRLIK